VLIINKKNRTKN